jgi:hypothetical protein
MDRSLASAVSTFVALTLTSGRTLTLTPSHHLPVGESCCSELKLARDVLIGDVVHTSPTSAHGPRTDLLAGAVVAEAVVARSGVARKGAHSPVMVAGSFPIVDGVVTAFDGPRPAIELGT